VFAGIKKQIKGSVVIICDENLPTDETKTKFFELAFVNLKNARVFCAPSSERLAHKASTLVTKILWADNDSPLCINDVSPMTFQ